MTRFYPNLPSNEIYDSITGFPGDDIRESIKKMQPENPIDALLKKIPEHWVRVLYNKIFNIEFSYKMVNFYYKDGFPDNDGPDLEAMNDDMFCRKAMFDYFVDVGFYTIQSAYDIISHILNSKYNMKLNKVYYSSVIKELKDKDNSLYTKLVAAKTTFNKTRNDFSHNIPPNAMVGFVTDIEDNTMEIKEPDYVSAKKLKEEFSTQVKDLNSVLAILKDTF